MDSINTPTPMNMSGIGYLLVTASTARGAIPLEGVSVTIRNPQKDRFGVLYALTTNRDGKTERVPLPAPPFSQSQAPQESKTSPPYAFYTVEVFAEGYHPMLFENVAVFDSITSVQPAVLIPLPENARQDSYTPKDGFTFIGEEPKL